MIAIHDGGPPPPCPDPFDIVAHVLRHADTRPDHVALSVLHTHGNADVRYGDLATRVYAIAGALQARHLPVGAVVMLRLGNGVDFPRVFLGAIAAGLVPAITSAQLTTPEVTDLAAQVAPALIVAEPGLPLPDPCPYPVVRAGDLAGGAQALPVLGDPDRPGYIVFTSGTSGRPRAVLHAHRAIWARGMMGPGWTGIGPGDRVLHAGAFNWTYTLGVGLLDPWAAGATALIPAPGTPATALPGLLARERATILAAAPGVYRQLLRADTPPLPTLRHGLSAGEKMTPELHDAFRNATGQPVYEAFGMSECSTFVSGSPDRPAPDDALGYPQPGRRVAILGPDHGPVAHDTPGTIAVDARDPGLMLGYMGAANDTAARFTPDGAWFLTGDTGTMAADGVIRYLGRTDDMMNAGGFRVSPQEVETAMTAHPDIQDAAAFEARISTDTTLIALAYVPRGTPPTDADLAAFAADRLARYKVPRLFLPCPALPRGGNGKILRRQLRQDFEDRHGQA